MIAKLLSTLAIENGTNAAGFKFIVPIKILYDPFGGMLECSVVLIAPSIVATAGHCVLNNSHLLTDKVYVGDRGSSKESIKS